MKLPQNPPDYRKIVQEIIESTPKKTTELIGVGPTDLEGRYLHWDEVRRRPTPETLSTEQYWAGLKLARLRQAIVSQDLRAQDGSSFTFNTPGIIQRELHWIDQHAGGEVGGYPEIVNQDTQEKHLLKSLTDEAYSSAVLEGAVATRSAAQQMITKRLEPKTVDEQMILNNYRAMQFIRTIKDDPMTPETVKEIHRIITDKTLDRPEMAGALRQLEDDIAIYDDSDGTQLHIPPPANELPERLEALCQTANWNDSPENGNLFVHPIVNAITLHFMLAYDHPFIDGNGRTARALFYWSMARNGYWLTEFTSISAVIRNSPAQYYRAFLYTETDENDLTYFLINQLDVIHKAVSELFTYLDQKAGELIEAQHILEDSFFNQVLNRRQKIAIKKLVEKPSKLYTIQDYQHEHSVSYLTARKDLLELVDHKLLVKTRSGRSYVFTGTKNLLQKIRGSEASLE